MIAVTTGRNPTQSTRRLSKELARYLPRASRLVRGKLGLRRMVDQLAATGQRRLVLVYRRSGGPSQLELMSLEGNEFKRIPPTIIIRNVKFAPTDKRGHRVKAGCVTVESRETLPLGKVLSDFFGLPLIEHERCDFNHSLHLSRDARKGLRLMILSLPERKAVGLTITIKQLRW